MKTKSIEINVEEAKLLKEAIGEKIHVFEKLEAACLRENLPKATMPIKEGIKKLQELASRLNDIVADEVIASAKRTNEQLESARGKGGNRAERV